MKMFLCDRNSINVSTMPITYIIPIIFTDADQAERFKCANNAQPTIWDCTLWDRLGTDFAYVHTGMFEWARAGTTLTISKIGSGIPDLVNPCIEAFIETEKYYEICVKYGLEDKCLTNAFFPTDSGSVAAKLYDIPTSELSASCSSGYCTCPNTQSVY